MKRKRYSEEQIVRILSEVRRAKSIAGICHYHLKTSQSCHRFHSRRNNSRSNMDLSCFATDSYQIGYSIHVLIVPK